MREAGLEAPDGAVTDTEVASLVSPAFQALDRYAEEWTRIHAKLDREGIVFLDGFLVPSALEVLQAQILEQEKGAVKSDVGRNNKKGDKLSGSVIHRLSRSQLILNFFNGVLGAVGPFPSLVGESIGKNEVLASMRGLGEITAFHFDGTFLNVIVPVFVPRISGKNCGQLAICPNIRSIRMGFLDRYVVPALVRSRWLRRLFPIREVDYRMCSIYLFYGYWCLHGAEFLSEAGLRCVTNITVGCGRF